jgi:hypothetical protein
VPEIDKCHSTLARHTLRVPRAAGLEQALRSLDVHCQFDRISWQKM